MLRNHLYFFIYLFDEDKSENYIHFIYFIINLVLGDMFCYINGNSYLK
jgi:hypothetical protein